MAWEENSRICLHMQLIAILSRIGVYLERKRNDRHCLHSVFERIVAALNAKVHIEVVVANLLNIYNSDMANDYFKFNLGHVS